MASPKDDVPQPEADTVEAVPEATTEFKSSAYGKALTCAESRTQG